MNHNDKPVYSKSVQDLEAAFDRSILLREEIRLSPSYPITDMPHNLTPESSEHAFSPMSPRERAAIREISQLLAHIAHKKLTPRQKLLLAFCVGLLVVPCEGDYADIKEVIDSLVFRPRSSNSSR